MTLPTIHKQQDPSERLWDDMLRGIRDDEGAAAQKHLKAGFPIYYVESDTPMEFLIKEYPGGQRELVRFHEDGDEVIRPL